MKKTTLFLFSSFFIFVTSIFGADTTLVVDSSVTVDSVINTITSAIGTIKGFQLGQATILIVLAAVIKVLLTLMKLPILAQWLNSPKIKEFKPYIAIVVGVLAGFTSGLPADQSMLANTITGALVGLSSIGIHETMKTSTNTVNKMRKTTKIEEMPVEEVKPVKKVVKKTTKKKS